MTPPELPDKLYFRIGEVAKLVGVKPYVLRYWETEFSIIRPGKTRARHRLYRRKDVESLLEIRRLLHTERYTIEGAKRRLRDGRLGIEGAKHPLHDAGRLDAEGATPPAAPPLDLDELRAELLDLHRMLSDDPAPVPPPLTIGERDRDSDE